MKITKSKFEPAVHLGLLAIVFVLLIMNFRSNLTIYHAGVQKRRTVTVELNRSALSIGRTVLKEGLTAFNTEQEQAFKHAHGLNQAILLASTRSSDAGIALDRVINGELDISLAKLRNSVSIRVAPPQNRTLIRGTADEYFYVHRLSETSGGRLLVLSQHVPELAYLEDSGKTLIVVNVIVVLLIIVVYLVLFRLILSPFRKLKRQAIIAGREVTERQDEVEAIVEEYQNIIDELKEKEAQLLILNDAIQAKADRMELFNRYLLRSISSAVIMVDGDGTVLSINKATSRIIGIDPDAYVGRKYHHLPEFCAPLFEGVKPMLDSEENESYREYDIKMPDGRTLSLGVTLSSIDDFASSRVGVSVLFNDLTEIKSLRGEVEAKNRLIALGEMAGGLAHQLRNSIGAMAGYSHLLKKRLVKHGLEVDPVNALEEEAKEAETLVDRFLHFARPFDFTAEKTDLNALISDLVETFTIRPENAHIEFAVENSVDRGLEVEVDGLLLKQALANLLENAINAYGGLPGTIDVVYSIESDNITIRITDQGCGISDEDLDKIFTPFFSSRPSGTGLGLPLARKIVDLHQGRLTVESKPMQGTTFTLILPQRQPDPRPSGHKRATTEA
ncbi:MAG: PAS domain S-box protein [Candidatus Zixiibacteriota bacterium]|nr:MAG: PAS domain S-box protein [candidate division Zixibacteria bacterium]